MRYFIQCVFVLSFVGNVAFLSAQNVFSIKAKKHVFDPREVKVDFEPQLRSLEAPMPGGDSYRGFLREQRKRVRERNGNGLVPRKSFVGNRELNPGIDWGRMQFLRYPNGVEAPVIGGIPNDNTLAISRDGILLSSINSVLYAYDTKADTAIFSNFNGYTISLFQIAEGAGQDRFYDPKLHYDPDMDRFILTFLGNNRPENSKVVFAFSITNDPRDGWNVYTFSGNPLDNNTWTDFPAIAITADELFYTANFIIPDVSWQEGFDGSMIWQIDKMAGYEGADSLPAKLWEDIRYDGRLIRNLHPVNGAEGVADEMYLLSNRNFDLENDTIFVLKLTGKLDDPDASLDIKAVVSSTPYGLPPNGRQANTNPNDDTDGLDINDSRVLGAFLRDNRIQFVSNCIYPPSGNAGIYHGFIDDPGGDAVVTANIIGHDTLDFGYPNIAWTGQQNMQAQSIIGFNHTSPFDFAGISAVYFSNDSLYSEITRLKAGENFVRRLAGTYDRWGDYFGIQRVYDDPGTVYTAGFYGLPTNGSGTWFNRLISPDTSRMHLVLNGSGNGAFCYGVANAVVSGGLEPYTYEWIRHPEGGNQESLTDVCLGDTVIVKVTDDRGTMVYDTLIFPIDPQDQQPVAYPNPFQERVHVQFTLERDMNVSVFLYNMQGQIMQELIRQPLSQGLNEFSFNTAPLKKGNYIIRVFGDDEELFSRKIQRRDW